MSDTIARAFASTLCEKVQDISLHQGEAIEAAANLLFACQKSGGKIYTFGTGHSYMIGQEMYARAGGYALFTPILENDLSMAHPFKSTLIERTMEYADVIEGLYSFKANDVVIMTSNSGRNRLIVELALRLKEKGVHMIAITAMEQSALSTSRHPSGKRLFELVDVVLDNRSNPGDASYAHTDGTRTAPTSTITDCFILHCMVSTLVQKLIDAGMSCPVFKSSNVDGADQYNEALFRLY